MEINSREKIIEVKSTEPFGTLLLELMHGRSSDARILKVQLRVGAVLVGAYIDAEIADLEDFGPDNYRAILHEDVARDLAIKAEIHARNRDINIDFTEDYFDGLEEISKREVRDLPELHAELEVVSVAANLGYTAKNGLLIDDQDLSMVKEEIQQAEAAVEVLAAIEKLRNT